VSTWERLVMSAGVELDQVCVTYGPVKAIDDATLRVFEGEFFSLLGPSGCGKTTMVRTIAGAIAPASGRICVAGHDMTGTDGGTSGPDARPLALIFQSAVPLPSQSAAVNIASGLRMRGLSQQERAARVDQLLDVVALPGLGAKLMSELSGSEKLRVALAIALAVAPKVLLLDEPFSALDHSQRQQVRNELRAIQQRAGVTFIYATHDQVEALSLSDRIAVLHAGAIEQVAEARTLYDRPETAFVASYVGKNNAFEGKVAAVNGSFAALDTALGRLYGSNPKALAPGADAVLFVRPETLTLAATAKGAMIEAQVATVAFEGNASNVFLSGAGHSQFMVTVARHDDAVVPVAGAKLRVSFDPARAMILPRSA
jgi:spermidine/putrescine transport system ATP-binding protein